MHATTQSRMSAHPKPVEIVPRRICLGRVEDDRAWQVLFARLRAGALLAMVATAAWVGASTLPELLVRPAPLSSGQTVPVTTASALGG